MNFSTKTVVAIGIGAALYAVGSYIQIPVGPNTSFRIAIAILTIIGAFFGPIAGFFVGFIGHALNDALMYGSVWWSWVFLSAILGLSQGLIFMDKSFDIKSGIVTKVHIIKMYVYSICGMVLAGVVAYIGDVFFYKEPADKIILQIAIATVSNFIVVGLIGIPVILLIAKQNKKNSGFDN